jgi:hypothetical protein
MPRSIDIVDEKMAREYFKGKEGRADIVALLEAPVVMEEGEKPERGILWASHVHLVWPNGRGDDKRPITIKCRETDDCAACRAAIKRPELVDPSGRGDPYKRKYAALVAWIATKRDGIDDDYRAVVKVLPWRFGGDKARDLKPIISEDGPDGGKIPIVEHDFAGTKIRLYDFDLKVACRSAHDEKVQKLKLEVSKVGGGKFRFGKKLAERIKDAYEEALAEGVMAATVVPPSNAELIAQLRRITKDEGGFGDSARDAIDGPGGGELVDDELSSSALDEADKLSESFTEDVDGAKGEDDEGLFD